MSHPNLNEEKKLWKRGFKKVAGVDEAGRGPLAGPVVAAAVVINQKLQIPKFYILNSKFKILKIRDSKQLTAGRREELYKILTNNPQIKWGIGKVSEKTIDRINIKNATELAMEKAIDNLKKNFKIKPDFLIIDGNHIKNHKLKNTNYKLIIKADEKVFSCAAASILAKVTRDGIMENCRRKYPQYGFDKHKGYGTEHHLKMLKKYGPCEIHRKSFRPVHLANKRKLC